ncbi:MAG: hypothetical protein KJO11_12260 [Gemmatimonadetes bacterium]|nr:hypothetical protein [Gemmatimonadota bacterium]
MSEDRGPVDAAAGDRAGRAQARGSAAIAAWLDRPGVRGPDSLSFNRWGEEGDGVGLRPGILSIGGITVPFCGGADVARCGFGARPWDLDRADHEAALRRGLEEQARWEDVQDRADAVARRRAGGG